MRWLTLLALVPIAAFAFQAKPKPAPAARPSFANHVLPFIKKHCLDCHTGQYAEDGIDLSKIKTAKDAIDSLTMMKKAARQATSKQMPPKDYSKQPSDEARKSFAAWIAAQKRS